MFELLAPSWWHNLRILGRWSLLDHLGMCLEFYSPTSFPIYFWPPYSGYNVIVCLLLLSPCLPYLMECLSLNSKLNSSSLKLCQDMYFVTPTREVTSIETLTIYCKYALFVRLSFSFFMLLLYNFQEWKREKTNVYNISHMAMADNSCLNNS